MFKKILNIFKKKSNQESDTRSNFRFDVLYVEDLVLEIKKSKYKLKEISLEGLSFFTPKVEIDSFQKTTTHNCHIIFKDQKLNVQIQVVNKTRDLIGCRITSNKDEYNNFIRNDLSLFLVSYLN